MLVGKMRSVRSMPVAKDIGAVTKWLISGLGAAAFRVIVENAGTLIPLFLASSDIAYAIVTRISDIEIKRVLERWMHARGTAKPLI